MGFARGVELPPSPAPRPLIRCCLRMHVEILNRLGASENNKKRCTFTAPWVTGWGAHRVFGVIQVCR